MNAGWLQGKENVKLEMRSPIYVYKKQKAKKKRKEMRSPRFHTKGFWILAMTLGKTNDACPNLLIIFLCKCDKIINKSPLKM